MKTRVFILLGVILSGLTACGGGGGSGSSAGTNPVTPSATTDCVIDQSVIGSCTLG